MRLSRQMFAIAALLVLLIPAVWAAPVVYEGFENSAEWTVTGNDINTNGASASVATETIIKTEGAASLKFTYNHSGIAPYQVEAAKDFTTPINLADALDFSFDVYGDSSAAADILWYVRFYTDNGKVFRYVQWDGIGNSQWQTVKMGLGALEWDLWKNTYDDTCVTDRVTRIEVCLQVTNSISAGTVNVYFDNFTFDSKGDYVDLHDIDLFNYDSDAEAQAVWATPASSGGTATISMSTDAKEGGKAMAIDYDIIARWWNISAIKAFPAPVDMSQNTFIRLWARVGTPPSVPDTAPLFYIFLKDAAGNMCRGYAPSAIEYGEWLHFVFFVDVHADPFVAPTKNFHEYQWDAGGEVDLTQIVEIHLVGIENALDTTYSMDMTFDRLQYGFAITPTEPSTAADDAVWSLYQ